MPVKVTETNVQYAERVMQAVQEREEEAAVDLGKVTLRVPETTIIFLDHIGSKFGMSKTAVAQELLVRAVEEVLCVVGLPPSSRPEEED